jgi:hypothetical protein
MSNETMQLRELASVRARLERIAKQPGSDRIFGASDHKFALHDPLGEAEIAAFEGLHHVSLPADYRLFLLNVGNGGAGPDYGIHRLGTWDQGRPWSEEDWLIGELAAPFPHTEAWNPVPFDPEKDDPADGVLDQIEGEYWCLKHVNGAMPICDHGCNIQTWLVVAGPEYGHLWVDRRVDWRGLYRVEQPGCDRITFSKWYLVWLLKCERQFGITSHAS